MNLPYLIHTALRFRRDARGQAGLANLHYGFAIALLRGCYHQIRRPRRQFPKFVDGLCRHSDVSVDLDPHVTGQATKGYVECSNAFGFIAHEASYSLPVMMPETAYNAFALQATGQCR